MSATESPQPSGRETIEVSQPILTDFTDHMDLPQSDRLDAGSLDQDDTMLEELMELFTKTTLLPVFGPPLSPLINHLPLEIKWNIFEHVGVHNIEDAVSLASSSKAFRDAWSSRSDALYIILTQSISPAVLPAAVLAANSHEVPEMLYEALEKGRDVAQLFRCILSAQNTPAFDRVPMSWRTARDIQEMGRKVDQLVEPFQHQVPGHEEDEQLGAGIALPTSETEMNRIKRAHYILEYLRVMEFSSSITLLKPGDSNIKVSIWLHLQLDLFASFSEIELRQMSLLARLIQYETDKVMEKRFSKYQRRLCCGTPREGICLSVKRVAWRLSMDERLTLRIAEACNIPSKRVKRLVPFTEYVGLSLKTLSKVYSTDGMLHQTPQGDAPSHPHSFFGIAPNPLEWTDMWESATRQIRSTLRFKDSDSGPEDLIRWQHSQFQALDQVRIRQLPWNILTGFDIETHEARWSSPSLLWYDRARLEQLTHGQLPTDI